MKKRYQVFVSSTYEDLKDERRKVIEALLSYDCLPSSMEVFPAASDESWDYIQHLIDDCDYYVVIIAGRYGSVDERGISFTEREYEYALAKAKNVLCFIRADPGSIPAAKTEENEKGRERLRGFIEKAQKRLYCKPWSTPDDLALAVVTGLSRLTREKPAVGWVRGDDILTAEQIAELGSLRTRVAELERKLADVSGLPPAGTEGLASGIDQLTLRLNISYLVEGEPTRNRRAIEAKTTWDEAFAALGPIMLGEADESSLQARLDSHAYDVARKSDDLPRGKILGASVAATDFDTVKLQLKALGLAQKSSRKHGVSDKSTYWELTDYGQTHLIRLRAIQRTEISGSATS